MIAMVLAAQVALPLALLVWLAVFPAASLGGYLLQATGIGAFLFAFSLVAQWAVVPWWLPRVYGALWTLAVAAHLLRGGLAGLPILPAGLGGWAAAALGAALLGLGGWYGTSALAGRGLPPVPVVDIANPFGPGRYLVGSGGSRPIVNAHMRTLNPEVERFRLWRGQSYALDFFGLNGWGVRATGLRPADPSRYAIFGAPLVAPCDGEVAAAENTMPDYSVPEQDPVNRLGNHVILRCGEAEIVLAHMQQGSLTVRPGQRVRQGAPLGRAGNSGASTEPHLHIHAQRPAPDGAPPISGAPLAIRIDGRFLVRGDRLAGRGDG